VGGRLEGKKILIVDDDQDILTAIESAFADSGAGITTAQDGNAALEVAEAEKPDLIILDAMLPKRSGFLVLERLRTMPQEERPKVVMISGNAGRRHQEGAASLGAVAFFNKPFRMNRLVEKVEELLA
jgi:DNA-binding response OmpR family regulator